MFQGSFPALVTPFNNKGAVDSAAFEKLVEWQIESGSHGLVPVGTTGESPTLTHDEHKRVVEECVRVADKRVPVIAGAGSNSTAEAIELVLHAEKSGANAALVVVPYYNKPTQDGIYLHYSSIAKASKLPIFIYNIPGRSVVDMSVETMAALHKDYPTIVGVKDSTCLLERATLQRLACGPSFIQFSGEDGTAPGHAAHGGVGLISVTANVAPVLCAELQNTLIAGNFAKAQDIHDRLMPLHTALFLEPGVAGAKYALTKLGRIEENLRSPLVAAGENTRSAIDRALLGLGLSN